MFRIIKYKNVNLSKVYFSLHFTMKSTTRYHLLSTLLLLAVGIAKVNSDVAGDFPLCTKYNNLGSDQGGSKPLSYHLETLKNNEAEEDEIFNGSFYVNPEAFGPTWISFKPIGEYAEGEEYRIGE